MKRTPVRELERLGYKVKEQIETGGSPRLFFRCEKRRTSYVAVYDGLHAREYLQLQRHLLNASVAVPKVHFASGDIIIAEDLGKQSLQRLMLRKPSKAMVFYKKAIRELIAFQVRARKDAPVRRYYDARHIAWEQEYFKQFFLRQYLMVKRPEIGRLERVFDRLKRDVIDAIRPVNGFLMHRDYQSSNIMVKRGRIRIIDFQSCRIGPLTYDLAALLRDAYVRIAPQTERLLIDFYRRELMKSSGGRIPALGDPAFMRAYRLTAIQRHLQALGAFANLSLNKGKPAFMRYISRGSRLLTQALRGSAYEKILEPLQRRGKEINRSVHG